MGTKKGSKSGTARQAPIRSQAKPELQVLESNVERKVPRYSTSMTKNASIDSESARPATRSANGCRPGGILLESSMANSRVVARPGRASIVQLWLGVKSRPPSVMVNDSEFEPIAATDKVARTVAPGFAFWRTGV